MLTLSLSFPGGRYHATPWGKHVNEADVAWPPDPWRLTRALIATWHRKLDHQLYPEALLTSLLGLLADEPPHYWLPTAVHSHTRHYMPNRQKSTLIFDAFARIDPTDALIVHWPECRLNEAQTKLLDELLNCISYVGRAESWVEAKRLDNWNGEPNCFPGSSQIDQETGEIQAEPVQLYAPLTPDAYANFQQQMQTGLALRKLKASESKSIKKTLPTSWLEAVSLDTADLQNAGWSAPPAAQKILYQRPIQALKSSVASHAKPKPRPSADTVRYAVYGKPLMRELDTIRFAEHVRRAVMGKAKWTLGETAIPPLLSGHGLNADNRHCHAFYLPQADSNGLLDHVLIHVPAGIDGDMRRVFGELKTVKGFDGQEWHLMLEHIGQREDFESVSPIVQTASVWQSQTPYLHPWHCKKDFDVSAQIRRECRERELPEPTGIQPLPTIKPHGRELRPIDFHRFRSKRGLVQPDTRGSFWQLTFAEPVTGPLALGFGCHFGLGLFAPVKANE
ncbi:type I-U CRISPR-associated protein Cas5/Cas6 [Methylomonas sp. LW13]|uniref:type I-G CRISPR-associated protein Csb2 n=1 Tax=unclassified Methylomonas TaxID=2608980 RepID=UPI00051AB62A|nr:type I-U CRISPR-associated protein Csb2 [Methylomonas sp. LW13]QBC26389.1 type I-U CRISPR-associated protein Cas5/Cas6 [Methylomonas sp. LW13]